MKQSVLTFAALAVAVALTGGTAHAQYYSSAQSAPPPLYPYVPQVGRAATQPYAVEVAPGTYVIHRPGEARRKAAARRAHRAEPAPQTRRPVAKTDPALVDELRQRVSGQKNVINTTKVVYKKPKIVETKRYVDLPPRVVERYTVVDDANGDKKVVDDSTQADEPAGNGKPGKNDKNGKRVIQADAEITVLGPDRMTIQLYRKGERGKNARLN